jgi:hypothetical protein
MDDFGNDLMLYYGADLRRLLAADCSLGFFGFGYGFPSSIFAAQEPCY